VCVGNSILCVLRTSSLEMPSRVARFGHARPCTRTAMFHGVRTSNLMVGVLRIDTRDNFLWGAPRIHGELLKLGFSVSQATVSRYKPDPRWRRSQSWRTFIRNQAAGIGLSELTDGRSMRDFIGTNARSWLRALRQRIVGFISDRFPHRRDNRLGREPYRNGATAQSLPGQLRAPLGRQHLRS